MVKYFVSKSRPAVEAAVDSAVVESAVSAIERLAIAMRTPMMKSNCLWGISAAAVIVVVDLGVIDLKLSDVAVAEMDGTAVYYYYCCLHRRRTLFVVVVAAAAGYLRCY